jgi:Uncharacterised nucleotidyltransferase
VTASTHPRLALWDRVEELIDRAPSWRALRAHRLHLIAARVRGTRGEPVPADVLAERRHAAIVSMAARAVLERARRAYGGGLLVMKGPEVAALYPDPSDRPFHDLDLLAENADAAQASLVKAGFIELADRTRYLGAQHLAPLLCPKFPLVVELHSRPNNPPWLPRVSAASVLSHAIVSSTGVDGLLAPDPAAHALLLAAHGWAHDPLGCIRDLVDVAATMHGADRSRTAALARDWGWDRMWNVVVAVTDHVLADDPSPWATRLWARHLLTARDRRVLENQLARIAAPICSLPARRAPAGVAGAVCRIVTRADDERWAQKLRRSRLSVRHALMEKSEHEQHLMRSEDALRSTVN